MKQFILWNTNSLERESSIYSGVPLGMDPYCAHGSEQRKMYQKYHTPGIYNMGNKCQITTSHHSSHTHEQRTNKMRIRADVYIKTMASRVMIGECGAPNDAPRESSCCMSLCVATSCVPIHALTGLHDELLQSPRDLKYCNTASAL